MNTTTGIRAIKDISARAVEVTLSWSLEVAREGNYWPQQQETKGFASSGTEDSITSEDHGLVDYGFLGVFRTIEFRNEGVPVIIGGAPLCCAYVPIDFGRFAPNHAQVEIEISLNNSIVCRAHFTYSKQSYAGAVISLTPWGAMRINF